MKLRVAIASLAVASVVVAAFAFTTKRTDTIQYLDESAVASVVIGSLQNDVDNPDNWATDLGYTFTNSTKLAAIRFDQKDDSDGSGDGQISKAEAVHALYAYYVQNGLPADNNNISVQVSGSTGNTAINILVRRKS